MLICAAEIGYRGPATVRPIPVISDLSLPALEILSMDLRRPSGVEWASVEPLISSSVIPNLRQCTLIYDVRRPADLRSIFASSLFATEQQHISLHFSIRLLARYTFREGEGADDPIDVHEIRTGCRKAIYCEYVSWFLSF
jgi:hypothetical protein